MSRRCLIKFVIAATILGALLIGRHAQAEPIGVTLDHGFEISARAESGIASVYQPSDPDGGGPLAANGEQINTDALTAAHKTLPFGMLVLVTNKGDGRSVVVRINDRGPYISGRVIDLTPAGARAIGMDGLAQVDVTLASKALFMFKNGGLVFFHT